MSRLIHDHYSKTASSTGMRVDDSYNLKIRPILPEPCFSIEQIASAAIVSAACIVCALAGTRRDLLYITLFLAFFNRSFLASNLQLALPHIGVLAGFLAAIIAAYLPLAARRTQKSTWQGPAKPYLVPCRTTHRRFFPEKHSFSYSYLAVGVPVGFQGSANGMIEIEEKSTRSQSLLTRLEAFFSKSWYRIHAADHFQRGQNELSLRDKLDTFLRSEGANPEDFSHAFWVTAARFAGYHFNPVSFWYLYSGEKVLAGMVLEVNNTFDERRPYLVLRTESEDPARIKGTKMKDFHVSPFNSRDGSYSVMAKDPLGPEMRDGCDIDVTITLNSEDGRPKLVARLFSEGPAKDPAVMGVFSKLRFLAAWFWVGFATLPRIIKEAVVLLYSRGLKVWDRPEPQSGTLGRHATAVEKVLEICFVGYLEFLVRESKEPIVVKLYASGLLSERPRTFASPGVRGSQVPRTLTVRVLTPAFYSRFVRYEHGIEAVNAERGENGTIRVDKPELLADVFVDTALFTSALPKSMGVRYAILAGLIDIVGRRFISSLDAYVALSEDVDLQKRYQWATIQQLLADRFLMDQREILQLVLNMSRICGAWVLASYLSTLGQQWW